MSFTFNISTPNGDFQFNPLIDRVEFEQKRHKEECFYRESFTKTVTISDPTLFKELQKRELNRCLCNVDDVSIDEDCCDDSYLWEGTFAFKDGEWDHKKCRVTFKPRIRDEYSCLLDEERKELNYLDIPGRTTVKTRYGIIQTAYCAQFFPREFDTDGNLIVFGSANLPPFATVCEQSSPYDQLSDLTTVFSSHGWSPAENYVETHLFGPFGGLLSWLVRTCYVREFFPGAAMPPGVGWIAVAGGWARSIDTTISSVDEGIGPLMYIGNDSTGSFAQVNYAYLPSIELDNAITLQDLITFMFGGCFPCVKSNFFGINRDFSNPDNREYQKAEQYIHGALIFQASDVIYADAINNATNTGGKAGRKKPKDLWFDLSKMFDLCRWVDNDGCLVIEHRSYNRVNRQLDLTTDEFKDFVSPKYTYDKDDLALIQRLEAKFQTDHIDFDDGFIEYQSECAGEEDRNDEETVKLKCFATNINRLFGNEDYLDDDNAINSIVLVAVDENGVLVIDPVPKTGDILINSPFSLSNIVKCWWTVNRPHCFGDVNGVESKQFNSLKKIRPLTDTVILPFDCSKYRQMKAETMDVLTCIGVAEIDSMLWKEPNCLELKLRV